MAVRPIDGNEFMKKLTLDTSKGFYGEFMDGSDTAYTSREIGRFIEDMPTLTPPNEWVSVEERLPEPGGRVLAANGSFVGEAYMASNGAWMRHDGFPWEVDAWMPMPDRRPPEREDGDADRG